MPEPPEGGGTIVALADLPTGTSLALDGFRPVTLKRSGFVGFRELPVGALHLVTIQGPAQNGQGRPPHGLLLLQEEQQEGGKAPNDFIVAHRYDAATEEVSAAPLDEISARNLAGAVRSEGQIEPCRMVSHAQLLAQEERDNIDNNLWGERTGFVGSSLLKKRGILENAAKIVPGSFGGDEIEVDLGNPSSNKTIVDGQAIQYPPIPVVMGKNDHGSLLRHTGTKVFLSRLSPAERTALLMGNGGLFLQRVLELYFDNDYRLLLGDLQLANVLFLNLHCFSSFEHWRDLVALLCYASSEQTAEMYADLYISFVTVIEYQLSKQHMGDDALFEDMEYTGGNFLLPAIKTLSSNLLRSNNETLRKQGQKLQAVASALISSPASPLDHHNQDNGTFHEIKNDHDDDDEDDADDVDDEDGPVVVSEMDYEACMARNGNISLSDYHHHHHHHYDKFDDQFSAVKEEYPILFAAVQPHEDVLMTCARALDTQTDVSLVREAAAYLAHVEGGRQQH